MFSPSSLFDLFCENERKGGNKTNKQKAQQIKTLFWRARYIGNLKRELKGGERSAEPGGTSTSNGGACSWTTGTWNESVKETAPGGSWLSPSFVVLTTKGQVTGLLGEPHAPLRALTAHPGVRGGCAAWCNLYMASMCKATTP